LSRGADAPKKTTISKEAIVPGIELVPASDELAPDSENASFPAGILALTNGNTSPIATLFFRDTFADLT
jgi:hypothetical protein